mgnify:FL=1
MASTIKDVAKLAGVSPSTVTRVLQDKSSISEATKKKVRKAMETLNYHPNVNARSLASKKTNVIGVVLPEDSDAFYQNSFFPEVIRGIAQIAADHQYSIQLCAGQDNQQRLAILKDTILGRRVDGLIFLYGELEDPLVNFAIEQQFPSVIIGKTLSPLISFVDNNNEKAGFDATEYIINKGASSIAFIGGRDQLFVSRERLEGYIKALEEYELDVNEKRIAQVDEFTIEHGYETIKELLEVGPIDGLVTADSLFAEGAARYLNEKQLQMPIITFDSVKPSVQIDAYVDVHTLELGRSAFKILRNVIKSNHSKNMMCYRQIVSHSIKEM